MNRQTHSVMDMRSPELARVIAVSNGFDKGEKSAIPVNLAICLAQLGKKVCVFDANELPAERLLLSVKSQMLSMNSLLNGEIGVDALIHEGPAGIKIIPHTTGIDEYSRLDIEQKENLLIAITQLQQDFDYILIDTAAEINESTISLLLGSGSIVITTTSDASSLADAFSLLKRIKLRKFQQPIKVVVNLVSSEAEARQIIARFSVAVRKYLGSQCGSMSFFIINEQILNFISQEKLITLEYPNSLPSYCLKNISLRLAEAGQTKSLMYSSHLTELKLSNRLSSRQNQQQIDSESDWREEAIYSVKSEPMEVIDPIMQKLNGIWEKRKILKIEDSSQASSFELELLKLKTAIHFASHIDAVELEN